MKFCDDHWSKLREAIRARGLDALVTDIGEQAASNLVNREKSGATVNIFDPLMGAHNAILNMAMDIIRNKYQQNPLMTMADNAEHPEWACPICALNWCHVEHNRICTTEGFNWPKHHDWTDEMIVGAADFVQAEWRRLNLT